MNYFSEISKILKSKMAPILPVILEPILAATEKEAFLETKAERQGAGEFDLDSDDEDDEEVMLQYDLEGVDEQVSAIHCLGNLCLNCSGLMQPYLERICQQLKKVGSYVHENVRYHCCLTFTQIAFGQLRFHLGRSESDDKLEWTAGLPV